MEGGIYDKLSEYFGTFAQTELLTCAALNNSFSKIREQAENINREYNFRFVNFVNKKVRAIFSVLLIWPRRFDSDKSYCRLVCYS